MVQDILDLEPSPRLLLGANAVELAERASRDQAAEAVRWAPVSRSAGFPPGE